MIRWAATCSWNQKWRWIFNVNQGLQRAECFRPSILASRGRGWNLSQGSGSMCVAAAPLALHHRMSRFQRFGRVYKVSKVGFLQDSAGAKALARGLIISQMSHLGLICTLYKLSVIVLGRIVVWQALPKHKNGYYYDHMQADCVPLSIPQSPPFPTLLVGVAAVAGAHPSCVGREAGFHPGQVRSSSTASLKRAAISGPIFYTCGQFCQSG